jgi:Carboxypeptidase regulatory-like domain/TonB dependent receptor
MRSIRLALFVFLVVSVVPLLAQTSFTSVRGTITDTSGALIPNAQVKLVNGATNAEINGTSDSSGLYQFPQLAPGTYTVTVTAPGFGASSKQAQLLVDQPATINFQLGVQAMQTVNVSAEAQTLNRIDATIGNAFNSQTIEALPSEGRNVPDLLSLQPGVLYLGRNIDQQSDSRSGVVNGARSDQTNVSLDGLDDNNQEQGLAFTGVLRPTLDSTEEYRVATTNANADSGYSSGAQVSIVTRSGTNAFHGSAYEYNRTSFGLANDWFNKASQIAADEPNVPGKLIRNTFGAWVGGPVKKDKLFFFGTYEGQRTAENTQITRTVPTASFKAGDVKYTSNGAVVTLNPAQIATMDPLCTANGTCPWGPGVDPNVLSYFSQYPTANGLALGDGLNLGSFTFSSPSPGTLNTSIAKLDYQLNDRHHLFIRGNLQKDTTAGVLQYPGQPASSFTTDNTKGLATGWDWSLNSHMVNDLRYGYVRQGNADRGIGQGDYVSFRFMDQATAQSRSTIINVPVHNVVDTFTWTKGQHSLSFGVNYRLVFNNRSSDASSYNSASTNEYWIAGGGNIANTGGSFDPGAFGFPGVDSGFSNSYNIAIAALSGIVPEVNGQYNYSVSSDGTSGTSLGDGTSVPRHFKTNEFEYFLQDSWRLQPNLTLTFGIRQSLLQTPYESNGQQVAPTIDIHQWLVNRAAGATQGQTIQPDITFAPSGQARGLKPYWPSQFANVAPRLSFAYSPDNKTSIRGGFGMYYDHFGQGIVNSFDQLGSFGLTTSITNPAGSYSTDNSPRFTGLHNLPSVGSCALPGTVKYPYTPPTDINCGFAITWGIDDHLRTPYSEAIDFSVQRELPGGFTLEAAYIGRLGRRLLQQLDLAEPLDLVDPKSGMDYFRAGTLLSQDVDRNNGYADPDDAANASVQAIPYFENLFPYLATGGMSATQNIYSNEWAFERGNETTALSDIDVFCTLGCGPNTTPRFYQRQFSSLYAWSNAGGSSYNAGQLILRHAMSHGVQFDLTYTLSNSIDLGSDTERTGELNGSSTYNSGESFSEIINTFHPEYNRGVSDFDTRHLINGDWVIQLPFGANQHFLSSGGRLVDGFVGGWQLSGLARWSSALPFSVLATGWATNWQEESNTVVTGAVKLHKHLVNGSPEVFADPDGLNNGVASGTPIRLPYPGEAGQRNNFRGDGYFDMDTGLTKSWKIRESMALKFAWEVFNATNSVRFDTSPVSSFGGLNAQITSGTLGQYSSTLSRPRVQQFSLRYSF